MFVLLCGGHADVARLAGCLVFLQQWHQRLDALQVVHEQQINPAALQALQ